MDFPYDLVTLGQFEAGGGWEAQVRQYVRKKYRQDLAGLANLDPEPLAGLFRGELLPGRPYASIQWVMRVAPFRPLELFLLFDQDPEFGTDLRVFYARKSLAVPTEDAYVFAWDYVALLARYGRGTFGLENSGPGPEWLAFNDFAPAGSGPMQEVSLGAREEILEKVEPEVAEVALRRMDCGNFARRDGGWEVVWPLLGDLSFRFRYGPAGSEMAFDSHGARKYGPEFLMSLSWLYINGLLRECRQVDEALPRLSRYF
ncbi:MAG: hypothetical protein M0P73_09375 [Syntrophobacterales bacterium]|nr:hypothetical protein [Syntrophobacterales bacterium]